MDEQSGEPKVEVINIHYISKAMRVRKRRRYSEAGIEKLVLK